jgi:hypothetical protein
MKTKFTLLFLLIALSISAQQVPNGGFETWTNPGNPDGWGTWESATGAPLGLATRDTVSKVEGNASLKLKTDSVQAGPQKLLVAGLASLGTASYSPPNLSLFGIPFSSRPDTLFFSYKYTPVGNDTAWVELEISGVGTGDLFSGGLSLPATAGQWVSIYAPLTADIAAGAVDSIRILFSSSLPGTFGNQGSVLNVDAVRLGYVIPAGINAISKQMEISVFPNPASDVLNIRTEENVEKGLITISDVTGKVVCESVMQGNNTSVNLSQLQGGVYIYKIVNESGAILKQERFNIVK